VRNYGDTKLSKFLKKMDFLEIETDKEGGTAMWVALKGDSEENKSNSSQQKRKRSYKKIKKT
jgi:hypothetical protein